MEATVMVVEVAHGSDSDSGGSSIANESGSGGVVDGCCGGGSSVTDGIGSSSGEMKMEVE